MIEYAVFAVGAAGAAWLLRRKHLQRRTAAPVQGIPCMARQPAGAGRWRSGRVYAEQGAARWVPGRGEPVLLTGGRATGVRVPSIKEGISINPGSRIVTCTYVGGGVEGGTAVGIEIEIAVMPLDLRELLAAVPEATPEGL